MNRINLIREKVKSYYQKPNPVIDWNEWIYSGHIEEVVNWVRKIAETQKFDLEKVEIAAYLHDLAYAWTDKNDPNLEEESEEEARKILKENDFSEDEIEFIVGKIIHGHGMQERQEPEIIEAKVLSTADALAHFTTDFYLQIAWNKYLFKEKSLEDFKKWALEKLERDFNNKIFFEEYKEIAKPYYKVLKHLYS